MVVMESLLHSVNCSVLHLSALQSAPSCIRKSVGSKNGLRHRALNAKASNFVLCCWEKPLAYDSEDEREGYTTVPFNESSQFMEEVERLLTPEERAILEKNAAPDFGKLTSPKWNPFHTLATSGQILILDDVLKHGVDVNTTDKDGMTALHKAILCKKEAVVSRLLKRGANPHIHDKGGGTALHYAVLVGAMQTVKLLIKYNVDVNAVDNDGWTPLHVAVQSRIRNIAKVLLVNGADKTIKNKDGNTAFDVAISMGKGFRTYEITKLLKLVPSKDA